MEIQYNLLCRAVVRHCSPCIRCVNRARWHPGGLPMEFSGVDTTQVLVTFISTIGAVTCAGFGKQKPEEREGKPPLTKWAWGMWVCILIAVINTGLLGWRFLSPPTTASVSITYPASLAKTDHTETVRGTVQGLPAGKVVWLVVFAQEVGRYYPQNQPANIEANDKWSSIAYMGVPGDAGKRFDLLAVVADTETQDAFNTYLADARDKSDWAGLAALPSSAVTFDSVTVKRQ